MKYSCIQVFFKKKSNTYSVIQLVTEQSLKYIKEIGIFFVLLISLMKYDYTAKRFIIICLEA